MNKANKSVTEKPEIVQHKCCKWINWKQYLLCVMCPPEDTDRFVSVAQFLDDEKDPN